MILLSQYIQMYNIKFPDYFSHIIIIECDLTKYPSRSS